MNIMIQGHPTRGKEVIKALEDLGGLNHAGLKGIAKECYYYITDRGYIYCEPINNLLKNFLTLEEYLKTKNNMEKRTIKISLETAKEWYKGSNEVLKKLALQAFTEMELQEITRVKSWEEFCTKYNKVEHEYVIFGDSCIADLNIDERDIDLNRNLLATNKDAEAFLALIQLKRLRDQWLESLNWKPDYTNNKITKYTIVLIRNKIVIDYTYILDRFLTFPTKEIAEDFLNCFKDLIEKAKELI